ncbi:hypothetical protein FQA39_LY16524 [Lamprigera yunnana]|nr:hypothetical protein FQA39_LY16524 [Lamprigera yunnana]
MPFTLEQDRFIVMAHFRSGTLNPDGNWSYSLQSCIEQFMQQYPDEMIEYDIFKQHKCRLVHRFETKNCICKEKSTGRPTVLTKNVIENIQERINQSPKKAVSQLSQQTGLSLRFLGPELSRQLEYWLRQADLRHGPARAIIAPHAGYQYCGACAGHAYRQISPVVVRRIFILGPSHHVRLSGCALSNAEKYRTPLYDLHVDLQVNADLEMTGQFEWMDLDTDENEHSIEMHLPYIAKVMETYKNQFTILPILVGSLSSEKEACYGRILSSYLADPQNLFVISSDFCHWGQRFRYTYYDRSYGNIYQSIEGLDRAGMNIIENLNPTEFTNYLKKYGNTICGRHPIGILLQAVQELLRNDSSISANLKFLKYAQSSQCRNVNDSSVSYASAALVFE